MSSGKLLRVIQRKEVFALAFGAMIGWSWVALSGHWIAGAGSLGAMSAFLAGGIAIIFVGFTYAELASAMPLAGGEHVYSHRALGPLASFVCTWAILLGYTSVVAFEAVALPTVVEYLVPGFARGYLWTIAGWDVKITWVLVGVVAAVLMTWINVVGIKTAARLQLQVTVVLLLVGLVLAGGSLVSGSAANMQPYFDHGVKGILGVLIMVPFMFVGFDVVPQSAEEANIPFRQIGTTLMLSIVGAVAWYSVIIWTVSSSLGEAQRTAASLPTADAAAAMLGGAWAAKLVVIGGIAGILTSWNAFLVGGSRALYAMAQAGQLPAVFGRLHPRFNTPHNAILLIGAISLIAPLFGRPALVWLVDAGGLGIVVAYAFVALSFIVLRYREPAMDRPYKVKYWRTAGFTALVLSLAIACLYLPFSPAALVWPYEWAIVAGWALLGALLFLFSRR